MIFIHGGYWQRNDKSMFSHLAQGPLSKGLNVAFIGYTLAPEASLSVIVHEVHTAIDHIQRASFELKFNPQQIIVGGWSAGAHLASLAEHHPSVRGVQLISGIFDLEPIYLSYINKKLCLSDKEVEELSPLRNIKATATRYQLFVGKAELSELQRQTQAFATALQQENHSGIEVQLLSNHNHLTILDELALETGILCNGLSRLIR